MDAGGSERPLPGRPGAGAMMAGEGVGASSAAGAFQSSSSSPPPWSGDGGAEDQGAEDDDTFYDEEDQEPEEDDEEDIEALLAEIEDLDISEDQVDEVLATLEAKNTRTWKKNKDLKRTVKQDR
eukprot:8283611-Pyramimonas_sp.AAC.1